MTTNRSRRLHKKSYADEFWELGLELDFHYKEGVGTDAVNTFMLRLISQAIEASELTCGGCDEFGPVCLARHGSVNEGQRALIEAWLKQQPELTSVEVDALVDA